MLTACTGKGGGYLPPQQPLFSGQASFGFTFSCQKSDLTIQLSYTDKGSNPIGSSFGIHGIVDTVAPPELESQICSGQEAPPGGNELIFLGRYRATTSPPTGFPSTCPTSEKKDRSLCRFEVIVRDNDANLRPSKGDFFSIKLSKTTTCVGGECSTLPAGSVFYARAGLLEGGNLTVK